MSTTDKPNATSSSPVSPASRVAALAAAPPPSDTWADDPYTNEPVGGDASENHNSSGMMTGT